MSTHNIYIFLWRNKKKETGAKELLYKRMTEHRTFLQENDRNREILYKTNDAVQNFFAREYHRTYL